MTADKPEGDVARRDVSLPEWVMLADKTIRDQATRIGTLEQRIRELTGALENCRLYAAGSRKAYWACAILRFCSDAGVTGSPLRDTDRRALASSDDAA
jgi:hypothetical protein